MATCEQWQAAVSARLDGEDPGVAPSAVRAHLDECSRCSTYATRIHGLDTVAVVPATARPDGSADILAAIRAEGESRASPTTPAPSSAPRIALGLAGLVHLLTSVPSLWWLADGHIVRDLAAFQLALGIGFLTAAARPSTAAGLWPTAAALVVVLAVVSMADIASGRVAAVTETIHVTEVVGAALLWLLTPRRATTQRLRPT